MQKHSEIGQPPFFHHLTKAAIAMKIVTNYSLLLLSILISHNDHLFSMQGGGNLYYNMGGQGNVTISVGFGGSYNPMYRERQLAIEAARRKAIEEARQKAEQKKQQQIAEEAEQERWRAAWKDKLDKEKAESEAREKEAAAHWALELQRITPIADAFGNDIASKLQAHKAKKIADDLARQQAEIEQAQKKIIHPPRLQLQ